MQTSLTSLIRRQDSNPLTWASRGVRNGVFALALLVASAQLSSAQTVTATKDDATALATKKNPGDPVTYTIQINATGSDATGVTLTDPTAANTSEVAGSLNVTPVALNDTYPQNVAANMTVNTATSGFTVVTNDYPGILAGNPVALSALTITTSGTSANGGIVAMTTSGANVGQFTYSAPPGFVGTDTFTYTISNSVVGTPAGSATGTVTMNVVGPVIWFVDDSAPAGGNGTWTGSNSKAFQTVTQAAAVDAANHRIYLASGTYTNGIVLHADEWVVGEGASGASFDAVMGTSYGTDTPARPAVGGTRPAWSAAAGSNVVLLANNNTILGVAITGNSVTAVTGTNVTTGVIGNASTLDTTLTGVAGGTFALAGGSGAFNVNATISSSIGRPVSITNRGAGVVTFSRSITDTGTGILLDNNDQSGVGTITFTGGLNISSGANSALAATNGGIVNATQNNTTIVNTLTTTTATALNVANTTIGGSGLTFRSVSKSGGTSNGIILDTAGTGGFTVTGTGTTAGTGGIIQNITGTNSDNTTGIGLYVANTDNILLSNMNFTGPINNYAIKGNNVTNFTLRDSNLSGALGNDDGAENESAILFTDLDGVGLFEGNNISGGYYDNLRILTTSGTLNLFVRDTAAHQAIFGNNSATVFANDSISVEMRNNSNLFALIDGVSFTGWRGDGVAIQTIDTANSEITIQNNTFVNNHPNIASAGGIGVLIDGTGGGASWNVDYAIQDNTFTGAKGYALATSFVGTSGKVRGYIEGNTIGTPGGGQQTSGSTTGSSEAGGMFINIEKNVGSSGVLEHYVTIENNIIRDVAKYGIYVRSTNGGSAVANYAVTEATIKNNTIDEMFGPGVAALRGLAGGNDPDFGRIGFDLQNNTFNADTSSDSYGAVFLDQIFNTGALFYLPGYVGDLAGESYGVGNASVDVTNYLTGRGNTLVPSTTANVAPFSAGVYASDAKLSGAALTQPAPTGSDVQLPTGALFFASGGVDAREEVSSAPAAKPGMVPPVARKNDSPPVTAPALEREVNPFELSQAELDRAVAAAILRWSAAGLSPDQLAALHRLKFEVANLPGIYLGEANGTHVRVDNNAGGNGWFIDASAQSEALFVDATPSSRASAAERGAAPRLRRYTSPTSAPAGRIDLLTTIMHEMGHALGLSDSYLEQDRDNLMYGYLTKGERRLPAKDQARGATPHAGGEMHFLTSPVVIGTLPASKSVVVTYTITINAGTTAPTISNQGTVSGSNFSNVLTDDPNVGGAADSTVTRVQQPPVVVNIAPSVNEDAVLTFAAASFDAGFSDPNTDVPSGAPADTLQVLRITSLPGNGLLKISGATFTVPQDILRANIGTLTYTPNANYNGADSFNWSASDGTAFAASDASANITVTSINDVPSFTKGADQTVLEDVGAQTVTGWATNVSSGPADESGQQIDFIVTNNNNPLFSVQPAVSATGDLTYTPAAGANGTAIVSVSIHDDGTTANGGVDTSAIQTFNINVTAVNDEPTLNPIPDPAPIPANSGQQTVNFSGITEGPANESAQTVTVSAVSNNTALIPNPTVNYNQGDTTGSLSYTPAAGQSGSAVITVTVMDNGGVLNSGDDTITRMFTVEVTPAAPTAVAEPPITEFNITPNSASFLNHITVGPDGNLWFTGFEGVGKITTGGVIATYDLSGSNNDLLGITAGPDGNLWAAQTTPPAIRRISTAGVSGAGDIFPLTAGDNPTGITVGPDPDGGGAALADMWFTLRGANSIGRITTAGNITTFPLPTGGSEPREIVLGPDGALWFTEYAGNRIGRIDTSGAITEFTIPTSNSGPIGITSGPDGALWFTEETANKIGRVTTAGVFTEFDVPTPNSGLRLITSAADGALWFTELSANNIGRITTAGVFTEYEVEPAPGGGGTPFPLGITAGPDFAVWFTESSTVTPRIGRIELRDPACPGMDCTTLVVNSTADTGDPTPGDNICGDGVTCTLRAALEEANALVDITRINFNIPGGGIQNILPVTLPLPAIVFPVVIDGTTQPGFVAATPTTPVVPAVVIDGAALPPPSPGSSFHGLYVQGGHSTVQGLTIEDFETGNGIYVRKPVNGSSDNNNTIADCAVRNNNHGIVIEADPNFGDADNNVVRGCYITDNNVNGVTITNGEDNLIGGTTAGHGNVICGHIGGGSGRAVDISMAPRTVIAGNKIGVDYSGAAFPNTVGIEVIASDVTIGGGLLGDPSARNIISANTLHGVLIGNFDLFTNLSGVVVSNNYIGVTQDGTGDLGNGFDGVQVNRGANANINGAISANVISGNGRDGVRLEGASGDILGPLLRPALPNLVSIPVGTGVHVEGNIIGTAADGMTNVGNSANGVLILDYSGNTIGGTSGGEGNIIAFNAAAGVRVEDSGSFITAGNPILGNSIFTNGGLGIDLGGDGITANDTDDPDGGANNLQNFPVLDQITVQPSGDIDITGDLNSTPSTEFAIDFYANPAVDGPNSEGRTYFGQTVVTTDANGDATFSTTVTPPEIINAGSVITATATRTTASSGTGAQGDTSEFSAPVAADGVNPMPTPTPSPTATPSPTPEPTATPSPTPEPTATPSPTPEPTATPSPTPEPTATPSPTPEPTATPSPTPEPTATPSPTPEPTATPSPTPEATATPTATPSATPGATPTPTATPSATPGGTPSPTPSATPSGTPAQALNISTRLRVDIGDKVMIGGFIIRGNAPKSVVIRGLGPSLADAGVPAANVLNDPHLELRGPSGALILGNDNWKDSPQRSQIEGTVFEPSDDRESVILATLAPGNYTAILSGVGQTMGVGLVEIYDNNEQVDSDLANISTRGFVQVADEVMIGGFTLGNNSNPTRIAVRALGPSLTSAGLVNVLQDPTLELHNANGTVMVSNDDWTDDAAAAAQLTANGLALPHPDESGIFVTLAPPGQFTAIVAGKNGGIGIALVEIYDLR